MKISRSLKQLTIEMDTVTDADHLEVALKHRQWIQVAGNGVRLAQTSDEPTMSDYDLLIAGGVSPIFRSGDPVKTEDTCAWSKEDARKPNESHYSACFVQGIGAGNRDTYAVNFDRMVKAGFTILRSPKGKDGRHWELWYIPGTMSLNGDLQGCNRRTLTEWLYKWVSPGSVTFEGERWCLSYGD